jgi:ribosomal protein L24E
MKCSNPNCSRGIGLVSYQRSSLAKLRFCSEKCRNNFMKEKPKRVQQERLATSYVEWLLSVAPSPTGDAVPVRRAWMKRGQAGDRP